MKNRVFAVAVAIGLVLSSGLGVFADATPVEAKSKKVSISKKKLSLKVGKKSQLKLKNAVTKKVKWKSSKPKVAKVSKTGLVIAKKQGKATITATYKKKKYTCKVTVKKSEATPTTPPSDEPGSSLVMEDLTKTDISESVNSGSIESFSYEMAKASLALSLCSGNSESMKKALERVSFKNFKANDDYYKTPTKDSIGVACAVRKVDEESIVSVVFRSLNYGAEWASNMTMGDGTDSEDHKGFSDAAKKAKSFILDYIKSLENPGKVSIWFSGHSRGAAVANIIAGEFTLAGAEYFKENGINIGAITAYCYATPKAVSRKKVLNQGAKVKGCIHNIVFDRDIVRRIPPSDFGFDTYGETRLITPDKSKTEEMEKLLKMLDTGLYTKYMNCKSENKPTNLTPGEYVDKAVRDLVNLTKDRKTYTEKYQNAFIFAMMTSFGVGSQFEGQPDISALTELGGLLGGYDMDLLTIDHYPEVEYAWMCTLYPFS